MKSGKRFVTTFVIIKSLCQLQRLHVYFSRFYFLIYKFNKSYEGHLKDKTKKVADCIDECEKIKLFFCSLMVKLYGKKKGFWSNLGWVISWITKIRILDAATFKPKQCPQQRKREADLTKEISDHYLHFKNVVTKIPGMWKKRICMERKWISKFQFALADDKLDSLDPFVEGWVIWKRRFNRWFHNYFD